MQPYFNFIWEEQFYLILRKVIVAEYVVAVMAIRSSQLFLFVARFYQGSFTLRNFLLIK